MARKRIEMIEGIPSHQLETRCIATGRYNVLGNCLCEERGRIREKKGPTRHDDDRLIR